MPEAPAGQRPGINSKDSAGWSWPRLLPLHEQQTRASVEGQFPVNTSMTPSVKEIVKQSYSPANMDETHPAEAVHAQSHPSSTAGIAPKKEPTALTGPVDDETSSKPGNSASATSDAHTRPSEANRDNSRLQSSSHQPANITPNMADPPRAEPSLERGAESSEINGKPLWSEDDRISRSLTNETINKLRELTKNPGAGSSVRFVTPSNETRTQTPDIQSDVESQVENNGSINDGQSPAKQPGTTTSSRRGTMLSSTATREVKGILQNDGKGQIRRASKIRSEDSDHSLSDKPSATAERQVQDIPLKEEKPRTPTATPDQSVMDRIAILTDPIPYYAAPKIMVHRPSQSSQSEMSGPRTIDEVLAKERKAASSEHYSPVDETSTEDPTEAPVDSIQPRLTDTPIGKGVNKLVKVRKRSLFLRKARNAAARNTVLKMTLGRQLATPTKQALRRLAHGETVTDEPSEVS